MKKTSSGFTIVELLIVIVVIAILAAISIVAYSGIQQRAKESSAKQELASFVKAIQVARINRDTHLFGITGSNCTSCGVVPYATAIDRIATASETNLNGIKDGDPWGNNYLIDENEGEGANPCAGRDSISVSQQPSIPVTLVPFYKC